MEQMTEAIKRAVSVHLPGRTVQKINDRGVWVRHIIEVTLDNNEVVFVKMDVDSEWSGGIAYEELVVQFFQEHGLPAPRVLVTDASCEILPHPYIIQEQMGGTQLGDLLNQADEVTALSIYEALGRFYGKMHSIHHGRSGLWRGSPYETFEVSPNDYMYQAEIVGGSGKQALEKGRITQRTYNRAVALWAEHMDYLKDHQPSLIHFSPFLWTIYLDRANGEWRVTKLMAMGDVLWWDPACNLAFLQYPPFGEVSPPRWRAFLRSYGSEPERKRILLYLVMQRLCAAMGTYREPQTERNKAWTERCLDDLDTLMDEIAQL